MPATTPPPESGFHRALRSFKARLTPAERTQCDVTTIDDLKIAILTIQAEQRRRRDMVHMGRLQSFLEAMEQFGKVVEVFLNTSEIVAFVWGPMKLLLLTASSWTDTLDSLLDAYQTISKNLPIFANYQDIFKPNERIQVVLESIWSDILEFHIHALRIFEQSMLRQFFRSTWKDFQSRFQHLIRDLQSQKGHLESHVNQIHIQQYQLDRCRMFDEFERAEETRSQDRYIAVVDWIRAPDYIKPHEDRSRVRQEQEWAPNHSAGRWILDNEDVKAWLAPSVPKASYLWINGIPGAGKSVLASVIIDEIKDRNLGPMAFFYCKDRDPNKISFPSIAKGFLSQLVSQQRHLVPYYYGQSLTSGEMPLQSTKLCRSLLNNMLQNIPKAFLVIDGLDECPEKERTQILDFFRDMTNLCDATDPGKLRVLILSRDEPDIRKRLSTGMVVGLDSRDLAQDIEPYVRYHAGQVFDKYAAKGLTVEDREYIEHHVLDRTQGMFLFAELVMKNLVGQPSLHHLQRELEPHRFPTGLGQAYARTLERIQSNPRRNEAEVARRILSLMSCSVRPLRWREVQTAISIDLEGENVDPDRRLGTHINEICGSLIEVLEGDRIEFVHTTAAFYIFEHEYLSRWSVECSMAALCLHYLSFECFDTTVQDDDHQLLARQGCYGFQDYAMAHWVDHILGMFTASRDTAGGDLVDLDQLACATLTFGLKYLSESEKASTETEGPRPNIPYIEEFASSPSYPIMVSLWEHAKSFRALVDNRRDAVGLPDLGRSHENARQVLEHLWNRMVSKRGSPGDNAGEPEPALIEIYGPKWFKCSRLSCYYFHEGFDSVSTRKQHYDRHERPFRCEDEECPASRVGFASQKELEKHKRNFHPGIAKLSSTFARLKKGAMNFGTVLTHKYPCPRCPAGFASRAERIGHMSEHWSNIAPKKHSIL